MDSLITNLKLILHQNKFPSEEARQCYVDMLHYLLILDLYDKYGECHISLDDLITDIDELLSTDCFRTDAEKIHYQQIYNRLQRLAEINTRKDNNNDSKRIFND